MSATRPRKSPASALRALLLLAMVVPAPFASMAMASNGGDLEKRSRQFVTDYYAALSSDTQTALAFIRTNYGDEVSYFGKWLDAAGVAERRSKLFERWPQRDYRISPGTLRVICNRVAKRCRVQTIVDWQLGDPDQGGGFSGIERNVLELAFGSGRAMIVFEGAESLSR